MLEDGRTELVVVLLGHVRLSIAEACYQHVRDAAGAPALWLDSQSP